MAHIEGVVIDVIGVILLHNISGMFRLLLDILVLVVKMLCILQNGKQCGCIHILRSLLIVTS